MRIIACGSRTFTDRAVVNTVLNGFWWPQPGDNPYELTIIEGGAIGADQFASDWAERNAGVRHIQVPADWRRHSRGAAGPIRNQQMLDEHGHIDLVIAFVNKPLERSVGTFDMVRRSRQRQLNVWVVEVRPPATGPQPQLFG